MKENKYSSCAGCPKLKPMAPVKRKIVHDMDVQKTYKWITDYITGEKIPDVGSEANRQMVERYLVAEKGYTKDDIEIDAPLEMTIGDDLYRSWVDLVVSVDNKRYMTVKCASGSLGSREREIISAARLLDEYQIPISVVSDGKTALVLNTISGEKIGEGLDAIPSKKAVQEKAKEIKLQPLAEKRLEREKLIFRSYDSMNVNVGRKISPKCSDS
ncbi:MAG: type I restriction enzyme HsdR N-terminal domain-containing protein [Desulfobacterales bacterium]